MTKANENCDRCIDIFIIKESLKWFLGYLCWYGNLRLYSHCLAREIHVIQGNVRPFCEEEKTAESKTDMSKLFG